MAKITKNVTSYSTKLSVFVAYLGYKQNLRSTSHKLVSIKVA